MQLEVLELPYFENVRFTYRYPEYTGWPSRETPLEKKGLKAIVGTESRIVCKLFHIKVVRNSQCEFGADVITVTSWVFLHNARSAPAGP